MAYKDRNPAFGFTENRTLQTENYVIKTSFPLSRTLQERRPRRDGLRLLTILSSLVFSLQSLTFT